VFVVDTNLLIYAASRESPQHERARRLVVEWGRSSESWRITWSVAYEFLRVVTHRSALLHPVSFMAAWDFIEHLCLSPSFGFLLETDRHAEVVRDLSVEYPRTSGNRMHDLHIAAVMRENGVVELRTADVGFHEFKFLRVVNPL
jgi:toxin-antitoxin system PIN domain toxin